MSQWVVAEFMSRVAERVSTAGEGFAAQLTRRRLFGVEDMAPGFLDDAFPFVEPSSEFIESLRRQILDAAIMVPADVVMSSSMATRRVVYGLAAAGSVVSAAIIAVVLYRVRTAGHRSAA